MALVAAALPAAAASRLPVAGACVLLATGRLLPRWAVDAIATAVAVVGAALAVAAGHGDRPAAGS